MTGQAEGLPPSPNTSVAPSRATATADSETGIRNEPKDQVGATNSELRQDHLPVWLKFTSDIASAVIWPLTIILVVIIFRQQLADLLRNLDHLKYPGGEASFSRDVLQFKTAVGEAKAELRTATAPADTTPKEVDLGEGAAEIIASTAGQELGRQRWPGDGTTRPGIEAVLDGWSEIEKALLDAASTEKSEAKTPSQALMRLRDNRLITPATLAAVRSARDLRNSVVHSRKRPNEIDAVEYLHTAQQLAETIRTEVDVERSRRLRTQPA